VKFVHYWVWGLGSEKEKRKKEKETKGGDFGGGIMREKRENDNNNKKSKKLFPSGSEKKKKREKGELSEESLEKIWRGNAERGTLGRWAVAKKRITTKKEKTSLHGSSSSFLRTHPTNLTAKTD